LSDKNEFPATGAIHTYQWNCKVESTIANWR
jgi:hypothetical protein